MRRAAPVAAAAVLLLGSVVVLAQQGEPPLPGEEPVEDAEVIVEGDQPLPDPEDEEEAGFLLSFIQGLLSAPGRQVQIRGVSGVLSSSASIAEIRVSDADGLWLRIEDVDINWSRRALFLRRVQVNELSIGAIEYLRPALPPEPTGPALADAEARPFALPELPLAVRVDSLGIDRLAIGEAAFGQAAELTTGGHLRLEGGELDMDLALERIDGPGGTFQVAAAFSNEARVLDLDVAFSEPAGGLVATALDIENRPAIDLRLQGAGPLDDLDIDFALDADGTRLSAGAVALRSTDEGLSFTADFSGELAPLVPPDYRDFFAGESMVGLAGVSKDAGGIRIDRLSVAADALALDGSFETGPDNFPIALDLAGRIGDPDTPPVTLPVPGGETELNVGTIAIRYGEGSAWDGEIALDGLRTGEITIGSVAFALGGIAENLQDAATRSVTIEAEGAVTGIASADPALARALGERIDLVADVAIPPDAPIDIRTLRIDGAGLAVSVAGIVEDLILTGRYAVEVADLRPFSGLAERPLRGAIDIVAEGDVALSSGGFDLVLDGTAEWLRIGVPQVDPLLAGTTSLSGRIARDEAGLVTDAFRIANPQAEVTSTGRVSGADTDIGFGARLADLGLVLEGAEGAVTAEGRATGTQGAVAVALDAAIPEGALLGRELVGLALGFAGDVRDGDVTGVLTGSGALDGNPISLEADVAQVGEASSLRGLAFSVGPNRITGDIARIGDAPIEGRILVDAPDIAPLAALALVEVEGSADAVIELGPAATGQGIALTAGARGVVVGDTRIGALDLRADIEDAFGVPLADANLAARDVAAGGVEFVRLDATAAQSGAESMDFRAGAELAIGTEATVAGALERLEDGIALTLAELALEQEGVAATLAAPATVTFAGETVTLTPLALDLGDGRIEAEGTVAETIDLAIAIDTLSLALLDTIRPDLAARGIVDGTARVTGPRDAPQIAFDIAARELSAAPIAEFPPLALTATGTTEGDIVTVDALLEAEGLEARVAGTLPTGEGPLDVTAQIAALPLELLDPFAGDQGLDGLVTGTARFTGTVAAPRATFDIRAADVTADPIAGLPPLTLEASGESEGETLALDARLTAPGGLEATATGTLPLGAGEIDLALDIAALPLAAIDPIAGGQGLQGSVTGGAVATGTLDAPEIAFDLAATGLSTAATRGAGIPALGATATGTTDGEILAFEAALTGPGGLQAGASGTVPLGDGPLDLSLELGALPLALIDGFAGDQGLTGSLTGEVAVTGSLADPQATFSLAVSGVSADILRENAIPPLGATATGSFAGGALVIGQSAVTGGGGIAASVSGTVPLEGPGLAVSAQGSVPLALANPALAERTAQVAGTAEFNLSVGGSLANPTVAGPVTVAGGTFVDPQSNIRLDNIVLDAALTNQTATIQTFSARSAFGGQLSASGTIGLEPGAGFPLDLGIVFSNLAYTDGAFVSTRLSGALQLTGPVAAGGGLLSGAIDLDTAEISVAEGLGAGGALALEQVVHRNAPPTVQQTIERARVEALAEPEPAGNGLELDVLVRAPNQIFVRGRGLDVELGGELRVTGSVSDIQPVGEFNLIRGRLNVLGQRIDFNEGSLRLVGNLDPLVFFVARTETQDAVAIVTVSGRVSAPDIAFSSEPELPQDEVLALVIFNRTTQQLSPFQIAQLAAAAAELAGRGGNGLLSQFRGAAGLDDLDIVTDETGGAALRAGRYIDDNIYLDVQTGTGGDTRVSINLDITTNVTARGTVATDGNSTIGIYYQRDY